MVTSRTPSPASRRSPSSASDESPAAPAGQELPPQVVAPAAENNTVNTNANSDEPSGDAIAPASANGARPAIAGVKMFLRNVPRGSTREDVLRAFGEDSKLIHDIWIARDPPGFGFLRYDGDPQALIARFESLDINGAPVKLEISTSQGEGGKRGARPNPNFRNVGRDRVHRAEVPRRDDPPRRDVGFGRDEPPRGAHHDDRGYRRYDDDRDSRHDRRDDRRDDRDYRRDPRDARRDDRIDDRRRDDREPRRDDREPRRDDRRDRPREPAAAGRRD